MQYGIPIPVSSVKADEFGDAQLYAVSYTHLDVYKRQVYKKRQPAFLSSRS